MSMKSKEENNNLIAKQWESSSSTFAAYAAQRHIPLGGTFELTPRCNLKCKMCYVRLDRSQMDSIGREKTAKEWIALAKDAINEGTLNLLITGGEPLLRDDFEEIYTSLATMGFIITLNTNGTLITPQLAELFNKYPPTATNVTLYGASSDTYEKICGNPNAFNQTINGLEILSKIPTVLEVRSTFIKDNMNELDKIRLIASKYTNRFAINTNVFKAIRGATTDVEKCRLSPTQIFDIEESNEKYYASQKANAQVEIENKTDTYNNVQSKDFGFNLYPKIISCLGAKSMYWITWDGKMLPCGSFSYPYTLPFEEGFKLAWDRLPTLFDNIKLPEECYKCEYADGRCSNCPAILQTESGSFDKISSYICEIAKERAKRLKQSK